MNILQMMVKLGIQGVEAVTGGLEQVEEQAHETAEGVHEAGEAVHEAGEHFEHFEIPVLEAVYAMQSAVQVTHELVEAFSKLSGVESAMEFNKLQVGLENITGSAEEARDMLKELREIGEKSPFDTAKFVSYAPQLLNAGVKQEDLPHDMQSLANLASSGAMDPEQMPAFMSMMVKMKNMNESSGKMLESINGLDAKKFVNAGAGTHFKTANQAYNFLEALPGHKEYDVLLKGADAVAKNAAAMALVKDPALAVAKSMETLQEAMEPTGKLILSAVGAVAPTLAWVAEQLKAVNEATGGKTGLALILLLVSRNGKLLWYSMKAAVRWTKELTEAIERYGGAAQVAAHATKAGAVGAEVKEATAAAHVAEGASAGAKLARPIKSTMEVVKAFAKNPAAAVKGIPAAIKAGKGMEFLKLAKLVKVADIATFLAGMGLETAGDHMRDKEGKQTRGGHIVQGIGEGIGFGGLGFLGGPIVGLVTTLIAAGVGGFLGNKGYNDDHKSHDSEHVKALKKNTEVMEELSLKGMQVGGGDRARRAISQMEMERGLAIAMHSMA